MIREYSQFFEHGFKNLGVHTYSTVYLFTDMRGWAARLGANTRRDDLFRAVISPLIEHGCTVLTPSFSYTNEGVFDTENTPSALGAFSRWFLQQAEVERSEHPLFSMAAWAPNRDIALRLTRDCGKSAFGARSIFERMLTRSTVCVHLGHNVTMGNTMIHHVEQLCGAPYRYNKVFQTEVFREGNYIGCNYSAFVRRSDVVGHDFETDASRNADNMRRLGIIREIGSIEDLSNITVFDYRLAFEAMINDYEKDPNIFLTKPFVGD